MEGLYTLLGALIASAVAMLGIQVREKRLDADRHTDRKQVLYVDLWIAADRHKREVDAQVAWRRDLADGKFGNDPGIASSEPAQQAFKAIELLAPRDVVARALELYELTAALGATFRYNAKEGPPVPAPDQSDWDQALARWTDAANAFLAAARTDLRRGQD